MRDLLPLLLTSFGLCAVLRGGEFCSPPDGGPRRSVQFFAGYSPVSSTVIGRATDRRFVAAGVGYSYRCWIWGPVSLSYTPTALPAAIVLQPRQFEFVGPNVVRERGPHAVYSFAAAPIGFTLEISREHRVYPFIETIEGVIASTEPVPEYQPNATGLNLFLTSKAESAGDSASGTLSRSGTAFCTFQTRAPRISTRAWTIIFST